MTQEQAVLSVRNVAKAYRAARHDTIVFLDDTVRPEAALLMESLVEAAALAACEAQFRNAFLMGCAGAWTLHPGQIAIAKKVFNPDVEEVRFALRILEALPDGSGVAMLDGKMQDDATWKQAKVIVDLADLVATKG